MISISLFLCASSLFSFLAKDLFNDKIFDCNDCRSSSDDIIIKHGYDVFYLSSGANNINQYYSKEYGYDYETDDNNKEKNVCGEECLHGISIANKKAESQ